MVRRFNFVLFHHVNTQIGGNDGSERERVREEKNDNYDRIHLEIS